MIVLEGGIGILPQCRAEALNKTRALHTILDRIGLEGGIGILPQCRAEALDKFRALHKMLDLIA